MSAAPGSVPWNAGTGKGWTDKRGYRWLYVKENGRNRARREHRVVMERALGRRLEPWEIVHHRDSNPSNNELSNLAVMTFGEHTTEHSTGSRRSADARRTMEAFALLREELKAERAVKAELLEACLAARRYDFAIRGRAASGEYRENAVDVAIAEGHDLDELYSDWCEKVHAAIAKATGAEA